MMDDLIIEPKRGIGLLSLGMTVDEVEECINAYSNKYLKEYHIHDYFRYAFRVDYSTDGKVSFIEILSDLKNEFNCLFNGIDVFNTKAEELVSSIDQISPYDRNHRELGFTYAFPELGLSLWRSRIFKDEDRNQDWYKEMCPENQEDELRFQYFETVGVESDEYRST